MAIKKYNKSKNLINYLIDIRKVRFFRRVSFYMLKLIGVEIPLSVEIGKNVRFEHWAYGLVIHPNTKIEDNVKLYQGVTIGRSDIYTEYVNSEMESVTIKKGAIICSGAKILCKSGNLIVGENTVIGANSVLTKSTGDNEIWAGVPAKRIKGLSDNYKKI